MTSFTHLSNVHLDMPKIAQISAAVISTGLPAGSMAAATEERGIFFTTPFLQIVRVKDSGFIGLLALMFGDEGLLSGPSGRWVDQILDQKQWHSDTSFFKP